MPAAACLLSSCTPAAGPLSRWKSGTTIPAEITTFAASSTVIDNSMITDLAR
jgi:hypothetical protein